MWLRYLSIYSIVRLMHSAAQDKILTELRETVRKLRVQARTPPHTHRTHSPLVWVREARLLQSC